ncbi:MAG TPA: GNAT family N-acetyltransferase [Nocardioides sp.]|nr:GNAT family N-acetyltransferase [Nocardioides sp.]
MLIQPATVEDAEELTDLHLDTWEEAYADLMPASVFVERREGRSERIARWREILAGSASSSLLARSDSRRLIGFASTGPGRDLDATDLPALELMALYVRAETYGTGIGDRLMDAAIGSAPAYLWVLEGNARAIRFYERHGFVFDGATTEESFGVERRMVRPLGD